MKYPFVPVVAAVAAASCVAMPAQAQAQNYPSRPITLIVPFAPGGGTDIITRIVAQHLSERLKQPVVVENKAGAGGNIGADYVALAKNDGYTILAGAVVAHAVNMTLQSATIRYDLTKSFTPISYLSSMPVTLVVNKSLPVKSASEFIEYVKQRPGQIAYASAGVGSTQHLAGEYFQQLTGTKMMHVGLQGERPRDHRRRLWAGSGHLRGRRRGVSAAEVGQIDPLDDGPEGKDACDEGCADGQRSGNQ